MVLQHIKFLNPLKETQLTARIKRIYINSEEGKDFSSYYPNKIMYNLGKK